jgi:hypothetical protein
MSGSSSARRTALLSWCEGGDEPQAQPVGHRAVAKPREAHERQDFMLDAIAVCEQTMTEVEREFPVERGIDGAGGEPVVTSVAEVAF